MESSFVNSASFHHVNNAAAFGINHQRVLLIKSEPGEITGCKRSTIKS